MNDYERGFADAIKAIYDYAQKVGMETGDLVKYYAIRDAAVVVNLQHTFGKPHLWETS